MEESASTSAPLAGDSLCRMLLRARAGDERARRDLQAQLSMPAFPWYHALALLHRQGLRAVAAPLFAEQAPVNVRLELEREAELEEARAVVRADRMRRTRRALDAAGIPVVALRAREREILIELDRELHPPARAALAPLDPAGPRPCDGVVNRLAPPALALVASGEAPPPSRWGEVLMEDEAALLDPTEVDRWAPFEEVEEPAPHLAPPPAFIAPATASEILAIRIGGVGDVLFTLPALDAVRSRYPGARLTLIGDSRQRELWTSCTRTIDEVEPFDWDLRDPDPARREPARARFLARVATADLLVVFGPLLALQGLELTIPVLELRIDRAGGHTALQLLAGAAAQGFTPPAGRARPVLDRVDAAARSRGLARLEATGRPRPWVGLAIGASTVYKAWPVERFAELALALRASRGATAVVLPAPPERALSAELAARAGDSVLVIEGASLEELPALLSACDLMVGNDTGPTHLAAAVGVPTLALHGFTNPALTAPLGDRVTTLGGETAFSPGSEESIRRIEVEDALAALSLLARG